MRIGIFDSGFGGLSIMRAIVKYLPQHDYIYLGDTARTPYGTRSREMVYHFSRQAVTFLFAQNCDVVIFACNTASAEALDYLQSEYVKMYQRRILFGVIQPTAMEAIQQTKNGNIGVLATEGTVRSMAFVHALEGRDSNVHVTQNACPLFVPLVENGEDNEDILRYYAKKYTKPLLDSGVDTIILGCTHYEFLAPIIQDVVGSDITLICEGPVVAQQFARQLHGARSLDKVSDLEGSRTFYTTDCPVKFVQQGQLFYGTVIDAKKVVIDD